MKLKFVASLAISIFTASSAFAQEAVDSVISDSVTIEEIQVPPTYKKVIWGIKGNIGAELPHANWTKNGETERMFNSGFGASLGAVANVYLGNCFYLEPEVSLFYEGYAYNNVMAVSPNSPSVNVGPNVHKLGMRVPLVVGYYIKVSDSWGLDVFTGPVFDYAFYGNARTENEEVRKDTNLMNIFKGEYAQRRCDFEWKVGIGFPVNNFLISLEGDIGITNMLKYGGTLRNNRVSLGIGYYFVGE